MGSKKSLGLFYRLELPHPALSNSGALVWLLSPIILMLLCTIEILQPGSRMSFLTTREPILAALQPAFRMTPDNISSIELGINDYDECKYSS